MALTTQQIAGLQVCTQLFPSSSKAYEDCPDSNLVGRHFGHVPFIALPINTLWQNGITLNVRFMGTDGSTFVREKVKQYANTWMRFANIRLRFVNEGPAQIRISFKQGSGSWSWVGTGNLRVPDNQATMNFGWFDNNTQDYEFSRTVIHEFGHALGCIHEHQSPAANIPWDVERVYQYYYKTQGWSREQVDVNIFRRYSASTTRYSEFDTLSIMLYAIPAELTTNGFSTD